MKIIIFLFLILISQISFSQKEEVKFTHLTIENGLSQSGGKCILKDSKGFMWFGTGDGLNRYDGYEFVIYRHNEIDPFSIGGNDVSCIYEDMRDSTLWIGTQDGGLNKYDRKHDRFITYNYILENPNSLKCNDIRAIASGDNGELWIGTFGGGIFQFDIQDEKFTAYAYNKEDPHSLSNNKVYSLHKNQTGELWIGTTNGLCKLETLKKDGFPVTFKRYKLSTTNTSYSIRTVYEDKDGNLWLGTQQNGLVQFNPDNESVNVYTKAEEKEGGWSNRSIRAICETKEGNFWIGTMNGLEFFDRKNDTFEVFKHDPFDMESLSCNQVFSIYEDNSGVLWVGTYVAGISKIDKYESKFPHYKNLLGPFIDYFQNDIRSLYVDDNNIIWVGSSNGLIRFSRDEDSRSTDSGSVKLFLKEKRIICLFESSDKQFFVSTGDNIYRFDRKKERFSSFTDKIYQAIKIRINSTNVIIEDQKGRIWFGTQKGLLKYEIDKEEFTLYDHLFVTSLGISVNSILSIYQDEEGILWLGTMKGGLIRFDSEKDNYENFVFNSQDSTSISSDKVFSIEKGEQGFLWLGTNRGLNHFDKNKKTFQSFRIAQGLVNNVVYAVLKDDKGNVWGSTNGGVFVYNPQIKTFRNYSFEDGLQSNEFNQLAYFKTVAGELYFGGINGFNAFFPQNIVDNPILPPVVITDFQLFNKPVKVNDESGILKNPISETKKIVLDYTQSVFSFEFTSLNFTLSQNNKYQYKLEGYDKEWVSIGKRRTASYTNLNPDSYIFMVKGSNNDGIWNDMPASIQIEILPPFWKTIWFKVLMVSLILLTVYAVFYFRLRGIKRKKLELEKQVKEKIQEISIQKTRIEENNEELTKQNKKVSYQNKRIEIKNEELENKNEHILEQRDELLRMAEQVREANHAKLKFFTNISHEFRMPLTLILGPVQQLLFSEGKDSIVERMQKFKIIQGNANKLLYLVNQIMDFRKVENEKMKLGVAKDNIVNFVEQIAVLFNDLAQTKKIKYQFISEKKKINLYFDPEKMEKIIFNLLSNAFKFTPKHGRISITIAQIDRGQNYNHESNEKQWISISVGDSGKGILKAELPNIFKRFYQLDNSESSYVSGSGIGLALVKEFIDLHHGYIEVKSRRGGGSKFKVFLPIGKSHFSDEELVKKEGTDYQLHNELLTSNLREYQSVKVGSTEIQKSKEATILVVEDNKDLRDYIVDILSEKYKMFEVENGTAGFELAVKFLPDLIVSDVMMPGLNGFELCRKIKSDLKTSHIPVVLLTALSSVEKNITGLEAGADAYISKPFDPFYFEITIQSLLKSREMLKEKFSKGLAMEPVDMTKSSADHTFLEKTIQVVEKAINDSEFGIEAFCANMDVNQAQLYRKLKTLTGLSINEFIRNLRLKKGAELLLKGEMNINEVAFEVGFNDPNYFSKCFLKQYNQTPSDFIKRRS
ncbi:MAG: hypothetical protein COC06_01670 [Bacteroidales bacterium]|nr:MAG: hypothetical protein COC06_01670 [Bacteroidales bacterium]